MEVEANRFSALILIPPPAFRKDLQALPNANLSHVVRLARRYDVSKEAMSRAYASYHDETLAIVVCKDGRILRTYRDTIRFPFIQPSNGQRVPQDSLYHRADRTIGTVSDFVECVPDIWISVDRNKSAPTLLEQVYPQQDGYGLILLKLERPDEEEEEEERELERSWRVSFR